MYNSLDQYPMFLWYFICLAGFQLAAGDTTLTVPQAGNCGDDTVMTCKHFHETCYDWLLLKEGKIIFGPKTTNSTKYSHIRGKGSMKLIIKNMTMSDAAIYGCACLAGISPYVSLAYECKPKNMTTYVSPAKRLYLTVINIYPKPTRISVTLDNSLLPGTHACKTSNTIPSHYSCTWTSSLSLEDVDADFMVTMTTVTQTNLTGNITVATPGPPSIINRDKLPDGRSVIRASEGSQVTLECVSRGGIPVPTLSWFKGKTSTPPLNRTETGVPQGDGTYTVIVSYRITAHRSEDMQTFICLSAYPDATSTLTQGSQMSSALLYLNRPPEAPSSVRVLTYGPDSATIQWNPGDHGNLDQTFVIQLSQDGLTWSNKTSVFWGQNLTTPISTKISGLSPGTTYVVRVFSYNSEGRSVQYSAELNFTTAVKPVTDTCNLSKEQLVGGMIGTLVLGLVVGVAITVILHRYQLLKKCSKAPDGDGTGESTNPRQQHFQNLTFSSESGTGDGNQANGETPGTYEDLVTTPSGDHYDSLQTASGNNETYYNTKA